jgi:adenylyltransferase/sulfurtransferase
MSLTEDQITRYSRNIILKEVGGVGQEKLLAARVLIIGAGGLGSPAALYLAAAGVGTLGLADADAVDLTNLQRQIAHFTADVGVAKVESAAAKIRALNPDVKVVTHACRVTAGNIAGILEHYDFVIDGTDNFATKFLINDACVLQAKPYSHAGILRFQGQTFTYAPGQACYRCVFPAPPPPGAVPTCSEAGILGAVAGVLGTLQATETLKAILGVGQLLHSRLLVVDALAMNLRTVKVKRDPACPVCGEHPSITALHDEAQAVCDLKPRKEQ